MQPQAFYRAVADDFSAVDGIIKKQLTSRVPLVSKIGDYITSAGGKRLRPLLVLLCGKALGREGDDMRLLAATETGRRDERQARDGVFLAFISEQRELDRTLGRQTAETFARALAGLADSIRDNGTATLAVMNEIRTRVDDVMNVQTDSIRETNYMLAKIGRDVDLLRVAHQAERDEAQG